MLQSVNSIAATPLRLSARADGGLLSPTPAKDVIMLRSNKSNYKETVNQISTSSSSYEIVEKRFKTKSSDMHRLSWKDASKRDIDDIFKAHFSGSDYGEFILFVDKYSSRHNISLSSVFIIIFFMYQKLLMNNRIWYLFIKHPRLRIVAVVETSYLSSHLRLER